jgi:hypothetical protein
VEALFDHPPDELETEASRTLGTFTAVVDE